jgi:hypothetical protein
MFIIGYRSWQYCDFFGSIFAVFFNAKSRGSHSSFSLAYAVTAEIVAHYFDHTQ